MPDNQQKINTETRTNVGAVIAVGVSIFAAIVGIFLAVLGIMGL